MHRALIFSLVIAAPLVCPAAPPAFDHVVIVIEENHDYSQIIGNSAAPYMNSLAGEGATFPYFYAFKHTSAPNYGELFSGDTNGINDQNPPASVLTAPNLGAALLQSGHSFAGYSEGLPSVGSLVWTDGDYVRRHNPWSNWQDDSANAGPNALPSSTNLPMTSFPTDYSKLPAVSFVVPNLAHDMHNGSDPGRITTADTWVKDNLDGYYQWARTHNSMLVVLFDEDSISQGNYNRIPVVMAGANIEHTTSTASWTLHNFLRTVEDIDGASHSGAAQYVRPISGIFNGDPASTTLTFRNGQGGYAGAHDTHLRQDQPTATFGADAMLTVDGNVGGGATPTVAQALVRFDNVLGGAAGQVPEGATVVSAKLVLWTNSSSGSTSDDKVQVHRMLEPWSESTTWSSTSGGISADNAKAAAQTDFAGAPQVLNHPYFYDVSDSVQAFADGAPNYGWALLPGGTDGYWFNSSENTSISTRPGLEVTFATLPRWKADAGGSWADAGNWYNGLPNAAGADVHLPGGRSGTITLDGAQTVGRVTFESGNTQEIAAGAGGKLVLDSGDASLAAQINAGSASASISAPVQVLSNAEIDAPAGQVTLSGAMEWGSGAQLTIRSGAVVMDIEPAPASGVAGVVQINPGASLMVKGAGGPFASADSRTLIVNQANLTISAGDQHIGALEGNGDVVVSGPASLTADSVRQNSLTLMDDAKLKLRAEGSAASVSTLNKLVLSAASELDLGNNDLILFYQGDSPLEQVRGYVAGGQLIASEAANPSGSAFGRTLAIWDNNITKFSNFDGMELPDFEQVLVKYTYFGDANLDGLVSPADYAMVDGNIGQGNSWASGDLNGDGMVSPEDYAQIDGNIGAGAGGDGGPQLAVTAVPEPGCGVICSGIVLLLRRRRRRLGRGSELGASA